MNIVNDPIVLFGAPRSGTTFLNELLNAHPEVHITHEMRLFSWVHEALVKSAKNNRFLVTHREAFLEHATKYCAGMIRDFYASQWPHIRYWGDKNPHYADVWSRGCLDTIRRVFPGTMFIHIIRDGRDVVASITRRRHADGRPWAELETAAWTWQDHVTTGSAFGRKIGPEHYLEIRYEDLVADGMQGAKNIFTFLDIPLDPAVEEFCLKQQTSRSAFSSPTRDLSLGDVARSEWKQALSEQDRRLAMHIIEPKLVELGYVTPAKARTNTLHDRQGGNFFNSLAIQCNDLKIQNSEFRRDQTSHNRDKHP